MIVGFSKDVNPFNCNNLLLYVFIIKINSVMNMQEQGRVYRGEGKRSASGNRWEARRKHAGGPKKEK